MENENKVTILWDVLHQLSMMDGKSLTESGLKTSEEVGEMAQAILSSQSTSGTSYKKKTFADVREESVDVIICALSVFIKANGNSLQFKELMNEKCLKWKEVCEKEVSQNVR